MLRFFVLLILLAAILCSGLYFDHNRHVAVTAATHHAAARETKLPHRLLWVWDRPEDLHELSSSQAGVAVLEGSLRLDGTAVFTPRRNPILLPANITRIAVVRIETGPYFGEHHRDRALLKEAAKQVVRIGNEPGISALQIDFDARRSERAFYRDLLEEVRVALPAKLPLEITALVSWCGEDDWIADLPVDHATPMFFRMEPGRARLLWSARVSAALPEPLCGTSVGVSTHEPWPADIGSRRIYVFPDRGWKADLPIFAALERRP